MRAALSAVYDHGGSRVWQERFGVGRSAFEGPVPDRTVWTEERIEAELRRFCKGRTTWPGCSEFRARDLGAFTLRSIGTVEARGGESAWAFSEPSNTCRVVSCPPGRCDMLFTPDGVLADPV